MYKMILKQLWNERKGNLFIWLEMLVVSIFLWYAAAMSYGAMLLLRDWLMVTSLGKTGLSTGMFNGAVFIAAFLFCLVLNLFSAGLPAWRMSRLNITDSING